MAETPKPAVVVVGSYNRDVVLNVPRFPLAGETLLGARRIEVPGGKGSNQAIQAARCGAATAMIAALGEDGAGDEALALWRVEGIDTSGVIRLAGVGTGMALILVDAGGENMIVVDSGANAALTTAHVEAAADLIANARVVVAQLEVPHHAVRRALDIGREAGALTLLNAAPAPDALDPDLLRLTDVLVVNAGEGAALSGETEAQAIAASLLQRVGRAVAVTLGGDGAYARSKGEDGFALPALPVDVVDTTGAGDAFVGALAHSLAVSEGLRQAVEFGMVAGALACTRNGAADSLAFRADIEQQLAG